MTAARTAQQQRRQRRRARKNQRRARRQTKRTFAQALQHFLIPDSFKQAQKARTNDASTRWATHPLILVLLVMTWCCGDSCEERFETARAFYVARHQKRRRPGQTPEGFQKALARLPLACLHAVSAGVRKTLIRDLGSDLVVDGFAPFGCDGSSIECPRTAELEQRLGCSGPARSAPTLWVTALVHLSTGQLWAWRLGGSYADERKHAAQLLGQLPKGVNPLFVADAGYLSYEVMSSLANHDIAFLVRMSSQSYLYTEGNTELTKFKEGEVYYWPVWAQREKLPPLKVRLMRVHAKGQTDVWLLTNVLSKRRLCRRKAARFYRWRWRNEGVFRSYKRTLAKMKLMSRTVRLVHREAEASLLAVQLLLAQGVTVLRRAGVKRQVSVRGGLRAIRAGINEELRRLGPRQRQVYEERLELWCVENRERRSGKVKRPWPGRAPHKPPKPPKLRTLTDELKAKLNKALEEIENP